jgi:poly-gamma-glutamate system protein
MFNKDKVFKPGIKVSNKHLLILSAISIILTLIIVMSVQKKAHPKWEVMAMASLKTRQAAHSLRELRALKNIPINLRTDPMESGFIGQEFSPITTTIGNLDAKQTSTNPDFAALFIRWFDELQLEPEDTVVIHISASFPALSIAAIISCEIYGLEPLIMSSAGASSYGANLPGLTYWDIENYLYQRGSIVHRTCYATPGGQDDNGSSLWEDGLEIIKSAANRNHYPLTILENLDKVILAKLEFITHTSSLKLFMNIGGNQSAMGNTSCSINIPTGLIKEKLNCQPKNPGLIHAINDRGIPIIHLLNIRNIAISNGISLLPSDQNRPGQGDVYFIKERPVWLSFILLPVLIVAIIIVNKRSGHQIPSSSRIIRTRFK